MREYVCRLRGVRFSFGYAGLWMAFEATTRLCSMLYAQPDTSVIRVGGKTENIEIENCLLCKIYIFA